MSGWENFNSDNSQAPRTAVMEVIQVPSTPKPKYIRLGSIRQIRFELATIYRMARNREMRSDEASRFTYMLMQLAQLTMDSELEQRVSRALQDDGDE